MRFGARFEGFGASEWLLQRANSLWWNPRERRDGRGARLTRRAREEYRVYFDRSATQSPAKRGGSGGMHRPSNAAWVLPQAVNSLWWNPRERRGRPVLPAGARRPADKVGEGGAPTGRRVRNSAWHGAASSAQVSRSRAMPGRRPAFQAVPALLLPQRGAVSRASRRAVPVSARREALRGG